MAASSFTMRKKLKQIADIRTGYQFRGKIAPDPEGLYPVIQIRDFDENGHLQKDGLIRTNLGGDVRKHLVYKDDVLFLSRGQKNNAVLLSDTFDNTVVASYFFVLKIKSDDVLPEYVAWYINQPTAQKYIYNRARRGTHMPVVPLSELEDLKLDMPDIETQKKILELNRLLDRENALLKELQNKRSLLIRSLSIKAAKKAIK